METYFDESKFPDGKGDTKRRTVRGNVLEEYKKFLG